MTNVFFEDEMITENDLYFICYMIERVARHLHQRNAYVVNQISAEEWRRLLSLANVLHCENPLQIEDDWISDYQLEQGTFDITEVDRELVEEIPYPTQMGKVYQRLIMDTMLPGEDYVEALIRIYNDEICLKINDYNCSAYYEPSYVLTRAYLNGGF